MAESGRMPSIREGVPDYSSPPMLIPGGKTKSRHEDFAESPIDDRDSAYGSMQSSLYRPNSNTSGGRRSSTSSFNGSERRPSAASLYDDDRKEIDGQYGASISGRAYERRDSYGSVGQSKDRYTGPVRDDDRRDIDGIFGFGERTRHERPRETSHQSFGDGRPKKGDYLGGSYSRPEEDSRKYRQQHSGYSESLLGRRHR